MGKIILKKSQYTRLRGSLLEMTMRSYIFDWDDNILYMPTTIKMDKKNGDKWVPLDVSTDDFVKVRNDKNYRLRDNNAELAFIDFRLSKPFIEDVKKAIHQNKFAPSADKFKEALINSRTFAINTARGHKPNTLKEGVKIFIDMVLTKEEKSKMLNNIREAIKISEGLTDEQSIDLYLDEMGEYYPVSSEEFGEKFGLDTNGSASNPEHAKKMAIEHFTKKIFNNVKKLIGSDYKKFSVGFSDDDVSNVNAAKNFIENELSVMYPEINFVIYDTSDRGKRKMVIEKE